MKDYSAATIEAAVKAAEEDLGQKRDQLTIKVVQQPRHGFLGIGRRPAKIQAAVKPDQPTAAKTKPGPKSDRHHGQQPNHHGRRPQDGKGASNQAKKPNRQSHHTKQAAKQGHKQGHKSQKHQPTRQEAHKHDDQLSPAELAKRHQANLKKTQEVARQTTTYLQQILTALGVKGAVETTLVKVHQVDFDVKTDQSGRVIGHHGRRINALEELASAFMDYHGADNVSVTLDTANYRHRRQKALERVAENAVVDVISTNQAVFLDPMPARERKQIHRQLEHNDHVITYSNGREPHRSVVIAPKN